MKGKERERDTKKERERTKELEGEFSKTHKIV